MGEWKRDVNEVGAGEATAAGFRHGGIDGPVVAAGAFAAADAGEDAGAEPPAAAEVTAEVGGLSWPFMSHLRMGGRGASHRRRMP